MDRCGEWHPITHPSTLPEDQLQAFCCPSRSMTKRHWIRVCYLLTAGLRAQFVLPNVMQLTIFLLGQLKPLLFHLIDLLLCSNCLLGQDKVVFQHMLLLPPPLHTRVFYLCSFLERKHKETRSKGCCCLEKHHLLQPLAPSHNKKVE